MNQKELLLNKQQNQDKFDKLEYDFYFYYSLNFGQIKLSPNHIAFLTNPHGVLFILEDKEKCKKIFSDFLKFVKLAGKFKEIREGVKTGIRVKICWAKKIKYLFKKKPSTYETLDYFKKLLTDLKFIDKYNKMKPTENITIDEIKKNIEDVVQDDLNSIGGTIFNIVIKIKDLLKGTTTSIANLINYQPEISFVEPLTQGKVSYYVEEVCKRLGIKLEFNRDTVGGLAYYNEFTKF